MTEAEAHAAEALWQAYYEQKDHAQHAALVGDLSTPHQRKMDALHKANKAAFNNKDFLPHLKELAIQSLMEIRTMNHGNGFGINHVRIVESGPDNKCCPECRKIDGTILKISDELTSPTLPHKLCTNSLIDGSPGFCQCRYEEVFDDEL